MKTGSAGSDKVTSVAGRRPVKSTLSATARVSEPIPAVIVAGYVLTSSGREIDAVTWLAYRPPRPARQKAASQTVLFISTPRPKRADAGLRSFPRAGFINLNFLLLTTGKRVCVSGRFHLG